MVDFCVDKISETTGPYQKENLDSMDRVTNLYTQM